MFGEGISRSGEIVDLGVEYGVLKKSGAWFSYNGTKLGQGRDAVKNVIAENPELAEELSKLIIAKMNEARDSKRKPGNPFLPNPDAKLVEEDMEREDESLLDRGTAVSAGLPNFPNFLTLYTFLTETRFRQYDGNAFCTFKKKRLIL